MILPLNVSGQELASWRNWAKETAVKSDISPTEVDWLLQEIAQLDALALRLNLLQERSNITLKRPLSELTDLWKRRLHQRIPVQYLVGVTPWRNFSLTVSPAVLIPRPETELIIDFAQDAAQNSPNPHLSSGHWVDLGTGSGAIALGLADVFPQATIHAVDISQDALEIAQKNANNSGFCSRIRFYQGSWWNPLKHLKGQVSGMVSNPPYIPSHILRQLQPEVKDHEPNLALDGGTDGLTGIRYLLETAPDYLVSDGVWLIEMMAGQGEIVSKLLQASPNYYNIKLLYDFAGIERFIVAYCR